MYGVVYHDQDHVPQLLVIDKNFVSVGAIDDDENVYKTLPDDRGEIVEVQQNDADRIMGLRSICGLTLHKYGIRFNRFYEGVNTILFEEPQDMAEIVLANVTKHAKRMELAQSEGAEVIIWPDGQCVLADDYRPCEWAHRSDDFERRWCSPNFLRKIGLLC